MTDYTYPIKNENYIFYMGLISQSNTKLLQTNPTIEEGDVKLQVIGEF